MSNFIDIELMAEAEIGGVSDPVLSNAEMPLRATYYPLGFPVEISTNSRYILEAAEESWGQFCAGSFAQPPLQLRIGVLEGESNRCPPAPVCRSQRNLFSMVADVDNFVVCDLEQRFAFGWLTQTAVEHQSYLRYHFLEAAALILLTSSYATPVHAACVSYRERGFLLCGDSGAGKSSLAYACARAGWTYTSDDSSYLIEDSDERRVVGNPYKFRLRPSGMELFLELEGHAITPQAWGKPSIEIFTAEMPDIVTASSCSVDHIVFLNRQSFDSPGFEPYPKEDAMRWLNQIPYGTPARREIQRKSLLKLLGADIWELRYSDLDDAINLLESIASRLK
ncbi:MAG: HPr(Ser) kinase/phosphatase [Edaphobacter sp.]|nr:HPr(Ser) kinase/phosphatase [Edaphobacter sp.]